jgi:hypothetical protein
MEDYSPRLNRCGHQLTAHPFKGKDNQTLVIRSEITRSSRAKVG